MIIHTYTICKNEIYLMPYFLRHYSRFSDKIFVVDDQSTDGTRELVKFWSNTVLLDYKHTTGLNEDAFSQTYSELYREHSRGVADWVICVDTDEFVFHPNIRLILKRTIKTRCKAIATVCYFMVSKTPPDTQGQLCDALKTGFRVHHYDKVAIFSPQIDATYGPGRHTLFIHTPDCICARRKICLLHYCYLSEDYIRLRIMKNFLNMHLDQEARDELEYRTKRALVRYRSSGSTCFQVIP